MRKGEAVSKYPGIIETFENIAYDNGGINRDRPESQWRTECCEFLEKVKDEFDLRTLDSWLQALTEPQKTIVSAGEHDDRQALFKKAPPRMDEFLNKYFDEVC